MVRALDDKVAAILILGETGQNIHAAERIFNERFPDRSVSRTYLRELLRILGNHIVGPLFLNTYLTGEVYLELLQNAIEPLILEILEDNPDEFGNLEIIFQQDGAPPHYHGAVRRYLDEEYRGRWIG
ncbi:hypothetical protein JTB14_009689 [Gonioctena quinquepunctata]|nr:hypothetical protein JTB14_009689 [Gonioctena quinquepunctata]